MSGVKLEGNALGTGVFTIKSPNSNTDRTFDLPDVAGTVALTSDLPYALTSGTAVASTSGTSIDFTGIPSWVKRITVMFAGVSTNGSSNTIIQLGAGSIETTTYLGSYASSNGVNAGTYSIQNSSGFQIAYDQGASTVRSGSVVLTLLGSNTWTYTAVFGRVDGSGIAWGGGHKALSGTLDRVRITTANGTDAYDAGSINILYE